MERFSVIIIAPRFYKESLRYFGSCAYFHVLSVWHEAVGLRVWYEIVVAGQIVNDFGIFFFVLGFKVLPVCLINLELELSFKFFEVAELLGTNH